MGGGSATELEVGGPWGVKGSVYELSFGAHGMIQVCPDALCRMVLLQVCLAIVLVDRTLGSGL